MCFGDINSLSTELFFNRSKNKTTLGNMSFILEEIRQQLRGRSWFTVEFQELRKNAFDFMNGDV